MMKFQQGEGDQCPQEIEKRQKSFDYEHRFEADGNRVAKKRIITGREYEDMLSQLIDPAMKTLRILRASFIFEQYYFQLETFTNIPGTPSFLLVESSNDGKEIKLPPFLKVEREVTGDDFYSTKNLARKDFEMKW